MKKPEVYEVKSKKATTEVFGTSIEDGFRLKRLDNTKPFSKKNCCWQKPRIDNKKSEKVYFL